MMALWGGLRGPDRELRGLHLRCHHGQLQCSAAPARTQLLFTLWRTIQDHDTLFVLAEIAHFLGIGLLGYKVFSKKSVAGG
jgi:hypothetical protein